MNQQQQQLALRPPVQEIDTPITFQILSIEVCNHAVESLEVVIDERDLRILKTDSLYASDQRFDWKREQHGPCMVYLFGVTENGNSICAAFSGFKPSFFIEVTKTVSAAVIDGFILEFEKRIHCKLPPPSRDVMRKKVYGWVPTEENVNEVRQFKFYEVFFPSVSSMKFALKMIEFHRLGILPGADDDARAQIPASLLNVKEALDVSEGKTQPSEKFMALHGLKPSSWATVSGFTNVPRNEKVTMCQQEILCSTIASVDISRVCPMLIAAVDIETRSTDYTSFPDAANDGDQIISIGTTFWVYGEKAPRVRVMQFLGACDRDETGVILTESYATETELLSAWRDLIVLHSDPDLVTSYNGTGFDFPYMAKRAERAPISRRFFHLGRFLAVPGKLYTKELSSNAMGQNEISTFPMAGRSQMDLFQYVKVNFKLSSYKLDDVCANFIPENDGKLVLDLDGWVKRLTVLAAAAISQCMVEIEKCGCVIIAELLLKCKMSIDEALICAEFPQTVETMHDAFERALVEDEEEGGFDAETRWMHVNSKIQTAVDFLGEAIESLPENAGLRNHIRSILDVSVQPALDASGTNNYKKMFRLYDDGAAGRIQIARYCQVDCDLVLYLMDRINVIPNCVQMSQVCCTFINDIFSRGQQIKTFNLISRFGFENGYVINTRDSGWDPNCEYQGATVMDPVIGFHNDPIVTLDFASLYPSLMRAFNLCYSSIVLDDEYKNIPGVKYGRYVFGGREFVFQENTKGVLPRILESLLAARKACKKEMKNFQKGSLDYRLADGRQLALKISCNSVYGFTGVLEKGMLACMPIASATTFNGRNTIAQTKRFMEERYGASVIYGDTDSVMLKFPGICTAEGAFIAGRRASEEATKELFHDTFRTEISLEFEKVYFPYLLVDRKMYAGLKYEDDHSHKPVLDVKGLALVRRDTCAMVRDTMKLVLLKIMMDRDVPGALAVVNTTVAALIRREIPLSQLETSSFLRKGYKSQNLPHLQVVKKMEARKAFDVPRCGDRISFVICEGGRDEKIYQRSESTKYAIENNVKVDLQYYLQNQLHKRLEKILIPLNVNVEKLFDDAERQIMRNRLGLQRLDHIFERVSSPVRQVVKKAAEERVAPVAVVLTKQKTFDGRDVAAKKRVTKKKKVDMSKVEQPMLSSFACFKKV